MDRCIKEWLGRAALPRAILSINRTRRKSRLRAMVRRGLMIGGRVELYFAFDDPCSAIALPALVEMVAGRDVTLELYPVLEHGIKGDPDIEKRRTYSLMDARRMGKRLGREITRSEPVERRAVEFLALWAEASRDSGDMDRFCQRALARLWSRDESPDPAIYEESYANTTGLAPPAESEKEDLLKRIRANEKRLSRKGHWESPAALVHGQWYFAHERLDRIAERLDYLGFSA